MFKDVLLVDGGVVFVEFSFLCVKCYKGYFVI